MSQRFGGMSRQYSHETGRGFRGHFYHPRDEAGEHSEGRKSWRKEKREDQHWRNRDSFQGDHRSSSQQNNYGGHEGIPGSSRGSHRPERHPPWMRGREIGNGRNYSYGYQRGLFYAKRSQERKARNGIENVPVVSLPEKTKSAIMELMYGVQVPFVTESEECDDSKDNLVSDKYRHIRDSAFKRKFLKNVMGNIMAGSNDLHSIRLHGERDPELDEMLKCSLISKQETNEDYNKMLEFRKKLPSYGMRKDILNMVKQNQVCLISGETGCGKTTQVAQFILDDYIKKNKASLCSIVCTQPRRISAISVAERVAEERAEVVGYGNDVGYQIRLEKKLPRKKGSILYCTTGIVLQWLQSDPFLKEVSHLILDEIHERDILCDFVLTILKDILPKRPDLKVILMSATLNAEQFSQYYDGCPSLNIPGFTYPVTEYYLEDVLELTKFQYSEHSSTDYRRRRFPKQKRMVNEYVDFIEPYIRHLQLQGSYSSSVLNTLRNPDTEKLNLELVCELVQYICATQPDGAILVFLPGWQDISTLCKLLQGQIRNSSRYRILPLHSMLSAANQKQIFNKPPAGVRKIVIATNIAETSITIDDVVYVVDCGKVKLKNFDAEKNISVLTPEWVSLANARQRKGRAGRVQPGICYHLYTRAREEMLDEYPLPEMLRSRLEEVVLQVKILQLGKVKPFLQKVMNPPDPQAISVSLELLQTLNALDEEENLTPLGYHLANLPMDPQTGKMILMAALFSCVDPVFSIAASLSFKDAFVIPLGEEKQVTRKKKEFAGGSKSDHLALAEAIRQWEVEDSRQNGGRFCWQSYLSSNTLVLLRNMKRQFGEHLQEMNFLKTSDPKAMENNVNSHNIGLIKAVICSGLYPNVAFVRARTKNGRTFVMLRTPQDGRVKFHPKSVNETEHEFPSPFIVYHSKLKTMGIFLHDTTMVSSISLIFFGKKFELSVVEGHEMISIDEHTKWRAEGNTTELVQELRRQLNLLLEYKVSHPAVVDWKVDSWETGLLRAIIELLGYEDMQVMGLLDEHESDEDYGDYK